MKLDTFIAFLTRYLCAVDIKIPILSNALLQSRCREINESN